MSAAHKPITVSDTWLGRLGIGIVIVHGRTVVRVSRMAANLLGCEPGELVGRDFGTRIEADQREQFNDWIARHYRDPDCVDNLTLPFADTPMGNLLICAGPNEGGPASTRMITLEPAPIAAATSESAGAVSDLRRTLKELLDGDPVPTFVLSADHIVMHWNRACEIIIGVASADMVGTRNQWQPFSKAPRPLLADLILDGVSSEAASALCGRPVRPSQVIPNGMESSDFFPDMGSGGRWLLFTAAPIRNAAGALIGAIETMVDVTELKRAEQALLESRSALEDLVQQRTAQLESAKRALELDIQRREQTETELLSRYSELTHLNVELSEAKEQIEAAQNQLVQNEKLASIGQLAAGVAHEINNPIGYVFSNFGSLEHYLADMLDMLEAYAEAEHAISDDNLRQKIAQMRTTLDLPFIRDDTVALMRESKEGIERVRKIVQDLKDFSHVDASPEWQWADIMRGLESTLNIAHNEIKYRADIVREFAPLPQVQCLPSQLNQVFMNMAVNAAHAMEGQARGTITVRTEEIGDCVCISFRDTGCGMSAEVMSRIFDPFFTTKPIGKGTGLGLSLSYGIVHKHGGRIDVESAPGAGTTFRITLPIRQSRVENKEAA